MPYLQGGRINVAALLAQAMTPGHGGIVTFVGVVRDHHDGRRVTSLSYSAYEAMAESVCHEIVGASEVRWPVKVVLAHRVGDLRVGDVAIAVIAAGSHRDEAFAACRWVVDQVKQRAPIWKREQYADGSEEWVDPTALPGANPAKEPQ